MTPWVLVALTASTATAAPVHLAQQGRLLDPTGGPLNGSHTVVVSLCTSPTPSPGEACRDETFTGVTFEDGYFSLLLGTESELDHSVFDAPALYVGYAVDGVTLGPRQPVQNVVPRRGGMLFLGSATADDCADSTNEGALIYRSGVVQVCTGAGWQSLAPGETLRDYGAYRAWSDGSVGASCEQYIRPPSSSRLYLGATGDGVYRIDPDGPGGDDAFNAWCDMSSEGGGWTLVLNLDTSDGHVLWWGNPLWTNQSPYGTADANPFDGDLKSPAYWRLAGTQDLRIVVHQQGTVRGYKRWAKPNGNPLSTYVGAGDNTLLGSSVRSSDVSGLNTAEFLVRTSTTLYANHCVNGACVGSDGGSPDGQRIGSNQSAPSNNNGGGLGNWSDMGYCCGGSSYGGRLCNGSTIRTCSEAQGGWFAGYGGSHNTGTFGTDSCRPMNPTASDTSCAQANWAASNGVAYDYAIYVR